jgi:dnd system-associated protein 4
MSERINLNDTIYIEEQWHPFFKELTSRADLQDTPFTTMKDMFMWAASLGYSRGGRKPLSGKKAGIFRWAQFHSQTDVALLRALAIADTGDLTVLQDQDKILEIVQEYANAGIYELQQALSGDYGRPLNQLLELLS